jgi:motility quorum-sensing regulator/GCU-specific mRNA interferase toxin
MLPYEETPTYDLEQVQWLVGQGELTSYISEAAIRGGEALQIGVDGIVEVVLSLEPGDFYKSMEAERRLGRWQDVYHRWLGDVEVYIKLQIDDSGRAVVIQFKRK